MDLVREENRIIAQVLAGNPQAYGLLVKRYQDPIYNLMLRMAGPGAGEDARDLCQETFLKAYDNLEQFHAGARFFPWLYSVGVRLALDYLRKRKRTVDRHDELDESKFDHLPDGEPEDAAFTALAAAEVRQALDKLPFESREALILRYHEDLTMQEIAQALSLTPSGAKMRVHRALAMLRKLLTDDRPPTAEDTGA